MEKSDKKERKKEKNGLTEKLKKIFSDPEIPQIIMRIMESPEFKDGAYNILAKSEMINDFKLKLFKETFGAERKLYHGVGEVLASEFFPGERDHFYETRWDIEGKVETILGKSPLKGGFVYDYQLINEAEHPQLDSFRMSYPAKLLSTANIIRPAGKSKRAYHYVEEIRMRLKSPQSLAAKMTNLLFGYIEKDVKDRIGCKIICEDSFRYKNCYELLELLSRGLSHRIDAGFVGDMHVSIPHEKNIEDTIKNPRQYKPDLKMIFTECVYVQKKEREGLFTKRERVHLSLHIEPLSTLKVENDDSSGISHEEYEKRRQESRGWKENEQALNDILVDALNLNLSS